MKIYGTPRLRSGRAKKNQSGVTLMETIIALGILITGITVSLSLMTSVIVFSQSSEQMIVVTNLAREGIELVRIIRSTDGFSSLAVGDKISVIDYIDGDIDLSNAGSSEISTCENCKLYLYNGRYYHNSPPETSEVTQFRRMVIISNVGSEKKIVSKIYWTERGREHNFKLETILTDW